MLLWMAVIRKETFHAALLAMTEPRVRVYMLMCLSPHQDS